jgi:hypothetical protein
LEAVDHGDHGPACSRGAIPAVAIYRLLQNVSRFEPLAIKAMKVAYEGILIDLRVTDRADPVTKLIAKKLIEYAHLGESDPVKLRERITNEFKNS